MADARRPGAEFRQTMAAFASGVTVVTTRWQGVGHAMTATAFCSVSLDPPLVLVCVSRQSRFHAAVTKADGWSVSLLSAGQEPVARHFANSGRRLQSQFDEVPHTFGPITDAPLIDGALGWLECTTYGMHDGGDHTVLVGRVQRAVRDQVLREPLTYYRGTYFPPSDVR